MCYAFFIMTESTNFKPEDKKPFDKISTIEELILISLLQNNLYGVQIAEAILETSSGIWELTPSTLYPTIKRLKGEGYITTETKMSRSLSRGGAKREVVSITDAGVLAVNRMKKIRSDLYSYTPPIGEKLF